MSSEQAWARGWKTAYSNIAGETFEAASNFNLLVIPMFVLMGSLAGVSGMSNDLFATAYLSDNRCLCRFCCVVRFIACVSGDYGAGRSA